MELMDGVILLEECTKTTETGIIIFLCSLIAFILAIIALAVLCIFICRGMDKPIERIARIISIAIAGISFAGTSAPTLPVFQEKNGLLEVIITQDADMDKLLEQYNIIDYENGKYIIEEKE